MSGTVGSEYVLQDIVGLLLYQLVRTLREGGREGREGRRGGREGREGGREGETEGREGGKEVRGKKWE